MRYCKILLSIFLIIVILMSSVISVNAIGEELLWWLLEDTIDYAVSAYTDSDGFNINTYLDYLKTPEGEYTFKKSVATMLAMGNYQLPDASLTGRTVAGSQQLKKVSDELSDNADAQYRVFATNKQWINELNDNVNGSIQYGYGQRHLSINDINITSSAVYKLSMVYAKWGNGGSCIRVDNSDDYSYIRFTTDTSATGVYVYSSPSVSSLSPPVICVTGDTTYFNGFQLGSGWYIVLNSVELLKCNLSLSKQHRIDVKNNPDGTISITEMPNYITDPTYFTDIIRSDGSIWKFQSSTNFVNGVNVYDKLVKSIGMCIDADFSTPPVAATPNVDDVADDNDNVIVFVRTDQPAAPVYVSPDVYNNNVNNITYVNDGDEINNIIDDSTRNEYYQYITNIYGDSSTDSDDGGSGTGGGGSYDDTNLINKLSNWFNTVFVKLDDIAAKIQPSTIVNNVYNNYINVEPVYNDFSDCFFDNVPAASQAKDLFDSLGDVVSAGDTDIDTGQTSVPDDSVLPTYSVAFYNPLSTSSDKLTPEYNIIDFAWYEPYRMPIRKLLEVSAYVMGFLAIWSSIKSVFGIKSDGGD